MELFFFFGSLNQTKFDPTIRENSQSVLELAQVNTQHNNLELLVHQQVNQYRKSRNLPPLTLDSRISEQARLHSQRMAKKTVTFSHDGFEQRMNSISRQIPWRSVAENVAYNQGHSDPVSIAVQGWIKSSGHHKNMIGNYNLTGIGVAKNSQGEFYFTQIFVLKR
jgi:uncharacterized protein YkwD